MPHYMIQVAYTPDAWAAMAKNPQNRADAVRPVIESMGGTLDDFYLAFGEYDLVGLVQFPNNASAAAFAIAATSGGALKSFKTTPLLTVEEGIEAMKKAGASGYTPPR